MEALFKDIPNDLRAEILLKAAAYADQSGNRQSAMWQATQDTLREAITEKREILSLIEQQRQNVCI